MLAALHILYLSAHLFQTSPEMNSCARTNIEVISRSVGTKVSGHALLLNLIYYCFFVQWDSLPT